MLGLQRIWLHSKSNIWRRTVTQLLKLLWFIRNPLNNLFFSYFVELLSIRAKHCRTRNIGMLYWIMYSWHGTTFAQPRSGIITLTTPYAGTVSKFCHIMPTPHWKMDPQLWEKIELSVFMQNWNRWLQIARISMIAILVLDIFWTMYETCQSTNYIIGSS